VSAMSFVGLLFLTSMILYISSRSKSNFISLVVSSVITLLPTISIDVFTGETVRNAFMFLPSTLLIGVDHFKSFNAFYMFHQVILLPVVAVIFASILTILMIYGAYISFKRHQVEN